MLIKANVELTINVDEDGFCPEKVEIQRKNGFKKLKTAAKTHVNEELDGMFDEIKVKSIKVQFESDFRQ